MVERGGRRRRLTSRLSCDVGHHLQHRWKTGRRGDSNAHVDMGSGRPLQVVSDIYFPFNCYGLQHPVLNLSYLFFGQSKLFADNEIYFHYL